MLSIWTSLKFHRFVLTLSQTTNFRLFRTERLCRWQFQVKWKWQEVLHMGRKHCGKKEKLLVTSNFSFSRSVFKRVLLQTRKSQGLFGNRLRVNSQYFDNMDQISTYKKWKQKIIRTLPVPQTCLITAFDRNCLNLRIHRTIFRSISKLEIYLCINFYYFQTGLIINFVVW